MGKCINIIDYRHRSGGHEFPDIGVFFCEVKRFLFYLAYFIKAGERERDSGLYRRALYGQTLPFDVDDIESIDDGEGGHTDRIFKGKADFRFCKLDIALDVAGIEKVNFYGIFFSFIEQAAEIAFKIGKGKAGKLNDERTELQALSFGG